jgi:hypothetical protein
LQNSQRVNPDMTSHLGPFRITSVEHPSKKALKCKADLKDVHKVYFEDADGFDSAYFPYAEPEKQRRRGGDELFYDFTYRATIRSRRGWRSRGRVRRFSRSLTPERKRNMRRSGLRRTPPVSRKPLMAAPASDRLVPYGGTDPTSRWRSERTLRIPALGVFPAENVKNLSSPLVQAITVKLPEMDPVPRLTW